MLGGSLHEPRLEKQYHLLHIQNQIKTDQSNIQIPETSIIERNMNELAFGSGWTEISAFIQQIPRLDDRLAFVPTVASHCAIAQQNFKPSSNLVLGMNQTEY